MPVRVLVVDDSGFFRKRLTEILSADKHIEVIGSAADGKEAIEQVKQLKPDVVTMDIEMPVMDGITAVRRIMESVPTPVLIFSSFATEGAKATFDALDAGAVDFLPKRIEDISRDRETARRQLCARVRLIGARGLAHKQVMPAKMAAKRVVHRSPPVASVPRRGKYKLLAIGTSTGGPVALQQVLTKLPAHFPLPIVLIQHMPATFTPAFAERLNKLCAINVKEAEDGDVLTVGTALLAPGGKQMVLSKQGAQVVVRIRKSDAGQTYKPSVDTTFASAAEVLGGDVLSVVLTGMGADGREGARLLKSKGSTVWAQDEASSVIYGMPAAIAEAGLADRILALDDVAGDLVDVT
ncbi:MAG TPA: chemotaxis response regulator protein-glutamate methylesterase [Candidatus Tenderia sp.]|nr:chemotaxis response regulator protein-glutamate methylesterase [Candidatus Tenderia sp.]